jgi:hypothetical protein
MIAVSRQVQVNRNARGTVRLLQGVGARGKNKTDVTLVRLVGEAT